MPISGQNSKTSQLFSLDFISRFLPESRQDAADSFNCTSKDFTRNRSLPLPVVLALLINMVRPGKRFGYQEVINRFFSDTGLCFSNETVPPSKSAFCKARTKLPFALLSSLFQKAVDQANDLAGKTCPRWNGFRLLAIDGTMKNLPNSQELRDVFGVPYGGHYPQLLLCALFDVLTKIPIGMTWGPCASSERSMALDLIPKLGSGDLLLLDRGYPSFELFAQLIARRADFLVRLPSYGLFSEVMSFVERGKRDGKVTIMPPKALLRECKKNNQPTPQPITLRVVKVSLPGKKTALFITTLTDRNAYPLRSLRDLYHLRWEEEEFYKLVKELLDAENFRGMSCAFIDQEIMATYLYCLLTRIMMMEAALLNDIPVQDIQQQGAFLAVTRFIDKIWISRSLDECEHWLLRCLTEISWQKYRKRPGRSYPRKSKKGHGKWARR